VRLPWWKMWNVWKVLRFFNANLIKTPNIFVLRYCATVEFRNEIKVS